MKRIGNRICAALLCALLLVVSFPLTAFADTNTERAASLTVDPALYYGREALATLPNAEALLYAYDQIVAGVGASQALISIYDGTHPLSQAELVTVMDAYRRDHVEQFWLANEYTMTYYEPSCILSISPRYLFAGEELALAKLRFSEACARLLSELTDGMSEFEIELWLHDRLAAGVIYDASGANAHNAYGALVEGVAVCEGYAEALQTLLHLAGIRSFIVLGESNNPATGLSESHAWNLVRVDGEYYHVDLTWNDQSAWLYHAYFNVTDATIARDHTVTPTAYALPASDGDAANYFVQKGGVLTSYTAESVGALLRENGLQASVYTDDPEVFVPWFRENILDIVSSADVRGKYAYSYGHLGNEVHVQIVTCQHTELVYVEAHGASCEADGNSAYYTCECGKLFADAEAKTPIESAERVRIPATGHDWDTVVCTADRVCLTCGSVETALGAHTWIEATCLEVRRCTECGVQEGELAAHADTNRDGVCDVCYTGVSIEQESTSGEQSTHPSTSGERPSDRETDLPFFQKWLPLWISLGGILILLIVLAAFLLSRRIG